MTAHYSLLRTSTLQRRRFIDSLAPSTSTRDSFSKRTPSSEFDNSDFVSLVLTKLVNLENCMDLLLPMVKQLIAHFRPWRISHVEHVPEIPVDTDKNLEDIKNFLNTKQNFEYMVHTLIITSGTTIAQITRRILGKLITNNYAKNFNWAGRTPKKAFQIKKKKI